MLASGYGYHDVHKFVGQSSDYLSRDSSVHVIPQFLISN